VDVRVDDLLRRLERLSAEIRERELELARLARERDEVRAILRSAAIHGDAGEAFRNEVAPLLKKTPTSTERKTVELIRSSGLVVDRSWLAKETGITLDAASIRLARCYAKGLLERPGKGRYFAPALDDRTILIEGTVPSVPIGQDLPPPVRGAEPAFRENQEGDGEEVEEKTPTSS